MPQIDRLKQTKFTNFMSHDAKIQLTNRFVVNVYAKQEYVCPPGVFIWWIKYPGFTSWMKAKAFKQRTLLDQD